MLDEHLLILQCINNALINERILDNASNRKASRLRNVKSFFAFLLLVFLGVCNRHNYSKKYKSIGFHWSNHESKITPDKMFYLNYSKLRSFNIGLNPYFSLKQLFKIFKLVLIERHNFKKVVSNWGVYLFYIYEYLIIKDFIERNVEETVYSYGTFCRRMQFIGICCKRKEFNHIVIQHGTFRYFEGIRRTFADEVILYFENDRNIVDQYFEPSKKCIEVNVSTRKKKFIKELPSSTGSYVFYGTNPNHIDINFQIIDEILKQFSEDNDVKLIVSPHPRENIVDYRKKYTLNCNVIVSPEKFYGCDLYVFRPSTLVLEAIEENLPLKIYISKYDRIERYLEGYKEHTFTSLEKLRSILSGSIK